MSSSKSAQGESLFTPLSVFESETGYGPPAQPGRWKQRVAACIALFVLAIMQLSSKIKLRGPHEKWWYASVNNATELCTGQDGKGRSYSGYIGLKGDTADLPKRSFYWLFEAQKDALNAPLILTIGGGPGTSGITNPMIGQSHCKISDNGTHSHANAWSEHFNLLALDHPVGVGYSYGSMVNNSRSAALDVYDFLQKFYKLFPHLSKNQFVVAGGSYGGMYVPHIATVIQEGNAAVASGNGQSGAIHINLESLMISNPISDIISYFRWSLHHRCYTAPFYNASTCARLFEYIPACLESLEFALENPSVENRNASSQACQKTETEDPAASGGKMLENYKKSCNGTVEECHPVFGWLNKFFNSNDTKRVLGVPEYVKYQPLSMDVNREFEKYGDRIQQAHLLYEPLLTSGIRVLHYIGKLDCNCGWPGTLSFLKLLRTPLQPAFLAGPDVPWPSADVATVRAVGPGAGNMTFILMQEAGHFVTQDQPELVKSIVGHWVRNEPFV